MRVDRLNSTSSKICGIGFGIPLLRKVFMGKEESKEMLLLFLRVEFMVRFFFFFFKVPTTIGGIQQYGVQEITFDEPENRNQGVI